uniref:Uncharacterized protein n=1 Tax=Haptolina brevifila TaxID=156173 RepID=A0A7S2MEN9_9EUKA|mmetsp:Transcript_50765/g.101015  ORF Transcript_50765/g.101015 Transcript_50765/m.101015 type:complete len:233 (+) Transcript_50765:115-813(+)
MGCSESKSPPPEAEPEPEPEPELTAAQKELAAINAKIAAAPKKEAAKAFKKGDKSTHKVQRVGAGAYSDTAEADAINAKIAEKAAEKAAAKAVAHKTNSLAPVVRGLSALQRMSTSSNLKAIRASTRRSFSRRSLSRRSNSRRSIGASGKSLVRQMTGKLFRTSDSATTLRSSDVDEAHPPVDGDANERWKQSQAEEEKQDVNSMVSDMLKNAGLVEKPDTTKHAKFAPVKV